MKKIKTLSVLLSALTAFSVLSITTASAVETNANGLKIIDYPENILEKDIDEILYGITIQMPDGSKIITDENTFEFALNSDYCDTFGYGDIWATKQSGAKGFSLSAQIYVSDSLTLDVSYWDDNKGIWENDTVYLDFPDGLELPKVFCKNGIVYEKNKDNTLTVKSMVDADSVPYAPLEIPETVEGMTVTAVADNAFLCSAHMSDVTIPKTVTSIGDKAFGYCSGNHIHEDDYYVSASPITKKFVEADDDEEFAFGVYYHRNSDEVQRIIDTYFADCDSVSYNEIYLYGTAKKSQILPLLKVDDIYVNFETEETNLDEYLVMAMDKADDETLIPITINTTATGEVTATKIRKALKKKYFDEDTEFYYDWYEHIYVEATKAQIEALKEDEYVTYISLGDSEFISSQLYYEIYDADDEDTFNIYFSSASDGNSEYDLNLAHEAYFDNCEGEYVMLNGSPYYIIYGATKQQIIDTSCIDYLNMNLFDEPSISKYNGLTIHGEAGSYAEEYAKANDFTFEQTKSGYVLGDVNLDGAISIVDATLIMKANVEIDTLTEQQTKLADFNNDGLVNVVDATEIQKKLAGF